jgi:hypothetical protein
MYLLDLPISFLEHSCMFYGTLSHVICSFITQTISHAFFVFVFYTIKYLLDLSLILTVKSVSPSSMRIYPKIPLYFVCD